ncbi:MAG: hypothetical protein J0H27_08855 [Xanthomonadales bacterium]|nr:hypothetical protein [Xanthomonadales bacterium]ODU93059.1 MAG: hypothetical protein ABT18_09855 [Rhodanobacter sp. SCN 66-43]OJY83773.1 MAG: hypothetical protein BGP23_14160 [Xanthomonadales bacterium 66-474]
MLIDDELIGRPLTAAERDEVMAEALRTWPEVEKRWREWNARSIAHQAAREAARVAAGLPAKCEAELAHEAQLEREWAEMKRHRT